MDNKKTLETSEIKDFYTILEVSKILNMSQKSVRRYVASGELDSIKINTSYRIPKEALEKFINQKNFDMEK